MLKILKISFVLVFSSFSSSFASFELTQDFVSVIDVNGTAILYDTSTDKNPLAARNQVIASQIRMENGLTVEDHIKKTTKSKTEAHASYSSLTYLIDRYLLDHGLSVAEYERYLLLVKEIDAALLEAEKFNDLFPSVIHYIKTLVDYDPEAKFILHSFGNDTAHVLAAITKAIPELTVYNENGTFNEDGHFELGGNVYESPSHLKALVRPGLNVWQANHVGWKKKAGGKVVWAGSSILFDDNADVCSRPIVAGQFNTDAAKEMMGREIHVVDTYQALVNEKYFIEQLQRAYPKVGK
jgi:hypothetical protein